MNGYITGSVLNMKFIELLILIVYNLPRYHKIFNTFKNQDRPIKNFQKPVRNRFSIEHIFVLADTKQ